MPMVYKSHVTFSRSVMQHNPIRFAGGILKPNISHCRRVNTNIRPVSSCRPFSSSKRCSKERLVILGSGWGGYEILRGVDKKRWGSCQLAFRSSSSPLSWRRHGRVSQQLLQFYTSSGRVCCRNPRVSMCN